MMTCRFRVADVSVDETITADADQAFLARGQFLAGRANDVDRYTGYNVAHGALNLRDRNRGGCRSDSRLGRSVRYHEIVAKPRPDSLADGPCQQAAARDDDIKAAIGGWHLVKQIGHLGKTLRRRDHGLDCKE